jgi:hypothetical protein
VKGNPFTSKANQNIEGSPLLIDNWTMGEVKLANGFLLKNVELQFDLYENELYFRKDNQVFTFADPVKEFNFNYTDQGAEKHVLFRKGYPDFDNHNDNSFYEVITDGNKVQLLKFLYKRIQEVNAYASPGKKEYADEEELFVYDVQKKSIIKIKSDKTSLLKALPGYENAINTFLSGKKKISQNELISLIQQLNG